MHYGWSVSSSEIYCRLTLHYWECPGRRCMCTGHYISSQVTHYMHVPKVPYIEVCSILLESCVGGDDSDESHNRTLTMVGTLMISLALRNWIVLTPVLFLCTLRNVLNVNAVRPSAASSGWTFYLFDDLFSRKFIIWTFFPDHFF